MVELQDSASTENSEDENVINRAYVPCGVGVTVQVYLIVYQPSLLPLIFVGVILAAMGALMFMQLFACMPAQQTEDGLLKVLGVVTGSDLMVGDILLDINGESVKGSCKNSP